MGRMKRRHGLLAAAALALGLLGASAPAEARTNRALLVAVTAYPNLPPKVTLVGPNHDAALVRDYLLAAAPVKFETNDVTVLADGLEGAAGSPTRAGIFKALDKLAQDSARGDFVYLHFSGHGAQQPVIDASTETDGLDEIFLPADTSPWADRAKGVPNALVDDEIGQKLSAIRAKGAFVWVVIDACHSGTATREAPVDGADETERKVEAADLGIPESAIVEAAGASRGLGDTEEQEEADRQAAFATGETPPASAEPTGAEAIPPGGMVAFFAAQTVETAPEMKLPKGAPDAVKYGLFTYSIFQAIAQNPSMTYRQLGAAVLQRYAADARTRPTPLFEGMLDAKVFGTEKLDTVMQWPLDVKGNEASLSAGLLQRLSKGTVLAVLPSPAAELSEALGYVEVRSAKNLSARVAPVAWNSKPAVKLVDLPPKPYARVAELAVDFRLKVARPAVKAGNEAAVGFVNAALDRVTAAKDKAFNVELVEPGAPADLRLAVLPERQVNEGAASDLALFFLPASGDLDRESAAKPPLIAIDETDPAKLEKAAAENLTKIFRAVSLSRLAAASDYRPEDFSVAFSVEREGGDAPQILDGASVPVVHPGDEVHIRAKNGSTRIVDLNVLYVGSDWSIAHIAAERMVPGASLDDGLLAFTDSSFGAERMIAVLTEAPPQSEIEDLSFLAQEGVRAATRDAAGPGGFSGLLADIGAAPSTRSVVRLADKSAPKGAVMIFPMETEPRE